MNERQQHAFDNPCKSESELFDFNFRRDTPMPGGILTSHLSIRLFEKPLAWHCSIGACDNDFKAIATSQWSVDTHVVAIEAAKRILAGVGVSEGVAFQQDEFCLRFRRLLTGDELLSVGQAIEKAVAPPPPPPAAQFYVVDVNAQ